MAIKQKLLDQLNARREEASAIVVKIRLLLVMQKV